MQTIRVAFFLLASLFYQSAYSVNYRCQGAAYYGRFLGFQDTNGTGNTIQEAIQNAVNGAPNSVVNGTPATQVFFDEGSGNCEGPHKATLKFDIGATRGARVFLKDGYTGKIYVKEADSGGSHFDHTANKNKDADAHFNHNIDFQFQTRTNQLPIKSNFGPINPYGGLAACSLEVGYSKHNCKGLDLSPSFDEQNIQVEITKKSNPDPVTQINYFIPGTQIPTVYKLSPLYRNREASVIAKVPDVPEPDFFDPHFGFKAIQDVMSNLSEESVDVYLTVMWKAIFGYLPSRSSLDYWAGSSFNESNREVLRKILSSNSFFTHTVNSWYKKFLGRSLDTSRDYQGSQNYFVNELREYRTEFEVLAKLMTSEEVLERADVPSRNTSGSNIKFLEFVFESLLGRQLDTEAAKFYGNFLNDGKPRIEVLKQIMGTDEYLNKVAKEEVFKRVMGRKPTSNELPMIDTFVTYLRLGGTVRGALHYMLMSKTFVQNILMNNIKLSVCKQNNRGVLAGSAGALLYRNESELETVCRAILSGAGLDAVTRLKRIHLIQDLYLNFLNEIPSGPVIENWIVELTGKPDTLAKERLHKVLTPLARQKFINAYKYYFNLSDSEAGQRTDKMCWIKYVKNPFGKSMLQAIQELSEDFNLVNYTVNFLYCHYLCRTAQRLTQDEYWFAFLPRNGYSNTWQTIKSATESNTCTNPCSVSVPPVSENHCRY